MIDKGTGITSFTGLANKVNSGLQTLLQNQIKRNQSRKGLFDTLVKVLNTNEGHNFITEYVDLLKSSTSLNIASAKKVFFDSYYTGKDYADNNDGVMPALQDVTIPELDVTIPQPNLDSVTIDDEGIIDLIAAFAREANEESSDYETLLKNNNEDMTDDLKESFDEAYNKINSDISRSVSEASDKLLENLHVAADKGADLKARGFARAASNMNQ